MDTGQADIWNKLSILEAALIRKYDPIADSQSNIIKLLVLVYHYQYLLIVVVVFIPQDLQISRFVLIPSMNFRQMWDRAVIVLFLMPAVDEMASNTFS